MAITDKKISIIYPGRDIASLSDRPNQDGMSASDLKARFDQLGKEVIPKLNALIDELFADLYSGTSQNGHTHDLDNLVDGITYKLFTALERAKLSAIAENAEVNQNAFSNVKVGSTTIASSAKTDTFELVAGLNVSIAVDSLTKKITLSATGDISTQAVQSVLDDIGNYYNSLEVNGALQEIGAILYPSLAKTTPHDDDTVLIVDSQDDSIFKKLSWSNIKATLKTYFDTVYFNYTHPTGDGNLHVPANSTSNNNKVLKANSTAGSYSWTDLGTVANGLTAKATPINADSIMIVDSAASNVGKKTTFTQLKAFLKTYFDTLYQSVLVSGTNIKTINGNSVLGSGNLVIETSSDWNEITAILTYASADSPTFVANTSIDLTSVISVGMKLKLTQATVKYFIVTAITSTTITLYGGTDYTLANATITLPYFSSMKAPFGFPLNPDKWSVIVTDTVGRSQENPANGVWYNVGSLGISVPIGLWNVGYKANAYATNTVPGFRTAIVTLSETNNGNTLPQFKCAAYTNQENGSFSMQVGTYNILNVTSKKQLYMNASTNQPVPILSVDGAFATTVIKAICAYL